GRVGEEALPERGIDPGPRDDACAVARPDARLVRLDDGVERRRVDMALFGQDGFERAHPRLHLRQFRMIGMVAAMMMMVIVVVRHRTSMCATRGVGKRLGGESGKQRACLTI